jgi:hypothetical protein
MSMAVRLSFRPGGLCQFSLLAQRRLDLPPEIEVRGLGRTDVLRALQDDWYELKAPADLAGLLEKGAVLSSTQSETATAKWSLAQRDVHVLGVVSDFGGYITTSRMVVGEEHVVLCAAGYKSRVIDALANAGCSDFTEIAPYDGIPTGWAGFKGVRPTRPVPATNDGDILETLRPLAELEIVLEGGIQVGRSDWLVGHAPNVRLRGDLATAGPVFVDEQAAVVDSLGFCEAPGKNDIGDHVVWSASATRTYRVVDGLQTWDTWEAHRVANGSICGCGVFPPRGVEAKAGGLLVPSREIALIGARPGEVHYCSNQGAWTSRVSIAFPPFDPIWAIPRFPLRCERTTPVLRMSDNSPRPAAPSSAPRRGARGLRKWSGLILDAHRRGLALQPADDATVSLWEMYEAVARQIWKRFR